jgi:phosphoglycolate phosphatase-like HAD superfamily hydrolase
MPLEPSRIRLICFDIDGTLADTDDMMVENIKTLLRPLSAVLPAFQENKFARKLIMMIETPANAFLHLMDFLHLDQLYFRIRKGIFRRRASPLRPIRLIPGAESTVRWLSQHYTVAIISVRDEQFTRSFIKQARFENDIHHFASAESCLHTKPYPDPILWVAKQAGISPENCLMVGDTTVDIVAGKRAGAQSVGVLSGFGTEEELVQAGADAIFPDVSFLLEILSPRPS